MDRNTEAGLEAARRQVEPRMTEALRAALDDYALEETEAWGTPLPGPAEVRYWVTRDGRAMLVSEMEDSHLINTIRFVERHEEDYRLHVFLSTFVNIPEWIHESLIGYAYPLAACPGCGVVAGTGIDGQDHTPTCPVSP